jgi:serine/threonine-protein kinase
MSDLMRDRVIVAIGDHYDVAEELGRGGMSVVYRAVDIRLRREVAIKVLPPDLAFRADVRARFQREAETAARLSHPHIVPIYSVGDRGDIVYLVMALVVGEPLGARLARLGPMPPDEAREILRAVADALAYAHSRGVVHRDIKPDNILLDAESGRPMVTDFGIARAAEADSRLTVTGTAMGTPTYMSPEQAMGERDLDGRSDIYALGVVAYQMLTGEPPFVAANTPAMLMKHVSERPQPLAERRRGLPPAMCAAIDRALAKRPDERWPDAGAFRDALVAEERKPAPHEWRAARPAAAPPAPAPSSSWPAPARRPSAPDERPWPPPPRRLSGSDERSWPSPEQLARERGGSSDAFDPAREGRAARRARRRKQDSLEAFEAEPVERRVKLFRQRLVGYGATSGFLFVINMLTSPWFPWFLFPTVGMGVDVARQWGSLWADGLSAKQTFGGKAPPKGGASQLSSGSAEETAAAVVTPEILAGPHGAPVRRAIENRIAIGRAIDSLPVEDRELLPEIMPTVDALVTRSAALATMLHRLDTDCSPELVARLDARIAEVEAEAETAADHERRLSLLQRQRSTVHDLLERREKVAAQAESVGMTLDTLKLDLVRLRSSGVRATIDDLSSATREARALSRELGHVLDAAREVRGL